jgi:hypothetical protein
MARRELKGNASRKLFNEMAPFQRSNKLTSGLRPVKGQDVFCANRCIIVWNGDVNSARAIVLVLRAVYAVY